MVKAIFLTSSGNQSKLAVIRTRVLRESAWNRRYATGCDHSVEKCKEFKGWTSALLGVKVVKVVRVGPYQTNAIQKGCSATISV